MKNGDNNSKNNQSKSSSNGYDDNRQNPSSGQDWRNRGRNDTSGDNASSDEGYKASDLSDLKDQIPTSGVGAVGGVGAKFDTSGGFKKPGEDDGTAGDSNLDHDFATDGDEAAKQIAAGDKLNPFKKGEKEGSDDDNDAKMNLKDEAKEQAKDAAKDKAKDAAKKSAQKAATKGATSAVAGSGGSTGGGTAAGAAGVGAAALALGIKAWGFVFEGAKALLGSMPVTMMHQIAGFVTKVGTSIVNGVNGAINAMMGALGFSATASGVAPTVAATAVVAVPTSVAVVSVIPPPGDEEEGGACGRDDAESGSTPEVGEGGGGGGANWKEPGSPEYVVAEGIFKRLVEKHGFNGTGAAAAVGNAVRESMLNPKADNPSGGVHGIFQWSGWSNTINGDRWGAAPGGKVDTLENELDLMDKELDGGWNKAKQLVGRATSLESGAGDWAKYYEGLAGGSGDKQFNPTKTMDGATWAYDAFEGDTIDSNESLLGEKGDASANDSTASDATSKDECDTGGTSGGQADGTGAVSATNGARWKPESVPEDVKKFIHDPKDAGLGWGNASGWWRATNGGGQCVHFSSSYFKAIWSPKSGKFSASFGAIYPAGKDAASAWAQTMGGKVESYPAAGAIIGIPPNVPNESTAVWGHTSIVQHVLKNGDIIVAEQNIPNYSGDNYGKPLTWNFHLISKAHYEQYKFQFYNPDTSKYRLSWDGGKTYVDPKKKSGDVGKDDEKESKKEEKKK